MKKTHCVFIKDFKDVNEFLMKLDQSDFICLEVVSSGYLVKYTLIDDAMVVEKTKN